MLKSVSFDDMACRNIQFAFLLKKKYIRPYRYIKYAFQIFCLAIGPIVNPVIVISSS